MNTVLSMANFGGFTDVGLGDALLYSVLGIAIIFVMLTILIVAVLIYRAIFAMLSKEKKVPESKPEPAPIATEAAPVVVNNDEEIAAVIGAVMAIYYTDSATGKTAPFRVKSILKLK